MAGGFDSLGLMPELMRSVEELGWILPTDVQDEAIPLILGGGDVMVAAETGSGKTAAFCLPMIQCVHETIRAAERVAMSEKTSVSDVTVKINENDKDSTFIIDPDGISCQSMDDKNWVGARASHGIFSGKAYFEFRITRAGGLCRLGWSTKSANLELGMDSHGFGYGGTGKRSYNRAFENYGESYGNGDIIGCSIDIENNVIEYSKNEKQLGIAFKFPNNIQGATFFPSIALKNSGGIFSFTTSTCKYYNRLEYIPIGSIPSNLLISSNSSSCTIIKGKRQPLAIILEPGRDLAEQVYQNINEFTRYVSSPSLTAVLLVGGDDKRIQQKLVNDGVDIVVATIGKAEDFVRRGILNLSQIRFFILDEADKLVDTQNRDSIMKLFSACPTGGTGDHRLQVSFFSATLHSPDITALSSKLCDRPTWVDLKGIDSVPDTVHHAVYRIHYEVEYEKIVNTIVDMKSVTDGVHVYPLTKGSNAEKSEKIKRDKLLALLGIIDRFQMSQCMIFCRTNVDCDNLETFLCAHGGGSKFRGRAETGKENPYSCAVLAGMRSMEERRASLEAFKEGDVRFLICTDVGARGIDVKGLPYVINMTLPEQAENYIHRIGRVGRAERMGLAISIVAANELAEQVWWHTCKSKGVGCTQREIVDKGGCTKWYIESELLGSIETRLHQNISELTFDFDLPFELAALNIIYGESAEEIIDKNVLTKSHVEDLKRSVDELSSMEVYAQNSFLNMKLRFGMN
eukprot:gene9470-19665_t